MDTQTQSVFNAFVHITDPAGQHHVFSPGAPVPDWARPLVGDHVLVSSSVASSDVFAAQTGDGSLEVDDLVAQAPGYTAFPDDDGLGVVEPPPAPPISGPGSGRPAWAEFAKRVGQPVTASQSRQDIIDALIRNGHLRE